MTINRCVVSAMLSLLFGCVWAQNAGDSFIDLLATELRLEPEQVSERYHCVLGSRAYQEAVRRSTKFPALASEMNGRLRSFAARSQRNPQLQSRYTANLLAELYELCVVELQPRGAETTQAIRDQFQLLCDKLMLSKPGEDVGAVVMQYQRDFEAALADLTSHELRRPLDEAAMQGVIAKLQERAHAIDRDAASAILGTFILAARGENKAIEYEEDPAGFRAYTGMSLEQYYQQLRKTDIQRSDLRWPEDVGEQSRADLVAASWPFGDPVVAPANDDIGILESDYRISTRLNRQLLLLPSLVADELLRLDQGISLQMVGGWDFEVWGANASNAASHIYFGEYVIKDDCQFRFTVTWRSPQRTSYPFLQDDYASFQRPTWRFEGSAVTVTYPKAPRGGRQLVVGKAGEKSSKLSLPEMLLIRRILSQQGFPVVRREGDSTVYSGMDGAGVLVTTPTPGVTRLVRLRKAELRRLHEQAAHILKPELLDSELLNLPSIYLIDLVQTDGKLAEIRIERLDHQGSVRGRMVMRPATRKTPAFTQEHLDTYIALKKRYWFKAEQMRQAPEARAYLQSMVAGLEPVVAGETTVIPRDHWPMAATLLRLGIIGEDPGATATALDALDVVSAAMPSVQRNDHLLRENLFRSWCDFWEFIGKGSQDNGDLLIRRWAAHYGAMPKPDQISVHRNRSSSLTWSMSGLPTPR